MDALKLAEAENGYITGMRRHFHQNPEIAWQEFETAETIERELDKMGIRHQRVAGTGIIAEIQGNGHKPVIGLRADMDALAITETGDIPYVSQTPGVMHACGHDAHIAMLLGAAKILSGNKVEWNGRVKLIFQPAEELIDGAKNMLESPLLEDVDRYMALHVWSLIPVGKVSVQPGPRMAAADSFSIVVKGRGGHGSMPHHTVDPVMIACALVGQLQTIVSRGLDPLQPAVVSVCSINGGTAYNVIPGEVKLSGTARCFSDDMRKELSRRIENIARGVCATHGATMEYTFIEGTYATINHPECSEKARIAVEKLLGPEAVCQYGPVTGGEDFAYYLNKAPGMLAFVGCGNEASGKSYPHHHEKFDIDEGCLPIGTALLVQYVLEYGETEV